MEAAETLSNSRVISIPAGYHTETTNWGGDGCAMSLAGAFMRQEMPDPDALDIRCVSDRTPPDFVLPDAVSRE